jgi:hypothetical protein
MVEKVKRRTKKPWITQVMISNMDEQRKWKNVNNKEGRKNYRTLRNELRIATEKGKKEYCERICDKIIEFKRRGHHDLMYVKTKELGWKDKQVFKPLALKTLQGNVTVHQRHVLKIWENYITELYDQAN